MTFSSYAQNFEDVMLWRALQHIQRGFYVDIGAQHPIVDSVSKGFYEKGWRGVHVEPVPAFAQMLREDRPDETVLEVAISDQSGTVELNIIPGTGLSTTVSDVSTNHRKLKGLISHIRRVPCLTLNEAVQDIAGGQEVHWLKIDVEGAEHAVLKGWRPKTLRPWIMVIEATEPGSDRPSFEAWEPLVFHAGYVFAYFDGLNRFYVAQEHRELLEVFSRPPNVFDGAMLSGKSTASWCQGLLEQVSEARSRATYEEQRATQLGEVIGELRAQINAAEARAAEANVERREFEAQYRRLDLAYTAVLKSKSWKLTAPLRLLNAWQQWLRRGIVAWLMLKPGSRPRRIAGRALVRLKIWVLESPRVRAQAMRVVQRFPRLKAKLLAVGSQSISASPIGGQIAPGASDMPVAAARLYAQLLRARAEQNKRGRVV